MRLEEIESIARRYLTGAEERLAWLQENGYPGECAQTFTSPNFTNLMPMADMDVGEALAEATTLARRYWSFAMDSLERGEIPEEGIMNIKIALDQAKANVDDAINRYADCAGIPRPSFSGSGLGTTLALLGVVGVGSYILYRMAR